jgi:hypothetical protein
VRATPRYVARMQPFARAAALAAVLLVAAPPRAAAQDVPFEPTGELRMNGVIGFNSVSFDQDRIVGPIVNLTRRDDGSWGGDLGGQDLDLQPVEAGLRAPNVTLKFKSKDGRTKIEGLYFGQRVRIELDAKKLSGRFGACSMTLKRKGPPVYHGDLGCLRPGDRLPIAGRVSLEVIGEAASNTPPLPQFALALLAVLTS